MASIGTGPATALKGENSPVGATPSPFTNPNLAFSCGIQGGAKNLAPTLWEAARLGAPALEYAPGPDGPGICPLPITQPPEGGSGSPLFDALLRMRVKGQALNHRDVSAIPYQFGTGYTRQDGLPGWTYARSVPLPADTPRFGWAPKVKGGRPSKLLRDLAVAVEADIFDLPLTTVAVRHDMAWEGQDLSEESAPHKARARGRAIWHALGIWPWAHVADELTDGWQDDPSLPTVLADWSRAAADDLRREADRA